MICSNISGMMNYCHHRPICKFNTQVSELTWEPSVENLKPMLGVYSEKVGCEVYAILFFHLIQT